MRIDEVQRQRDAALAALDAVDDAAALEAWRTAALGRASAVAALLGQIKAVPADERPAFGAAVNAARQALEAAFEARRAALEARALGEALGSDRIDVTLPGTLPPRGGLHPVTRALRRICRIFADMGFQVYQSREVETDDLNFTLLNTPPHHPARDMQDTFYVTDDVVLRTHTSPGQIHAMREHAPEPLRIILPGVVYRNEKITARSEIQFTQIEGLAIGEGITMADLKGTVENFVRRLYGPDRAVRFRASYFPFTEPSAEVDVSCMLCGGRGCQICKGGGWLEIMGCGMVHPTVLANGGYDPDRFTGFAFGGGVERVALLRYGIDDIRHFWANDLRFLEQLR
ncbi:phenylalanine--tRNA ligase subunit alpha [bacterium]|nr:MAG: phenylalanine--tRNA ligase subunit alpha [bacterium]